MITHAAAKRLPIPAPGNTFRTVHLSSFRPIALLLVALAVGSCGKAPEGKEEKSRATDESTRNAIQLLFTYGSEKEEWVKAVTDDFNRRQMKIASGRAIKVTATPKGSGELIDELISGSTQAHLASPASGAFIKLGNAQARAKTGKDLIGATENLVLSPVVIAMWKPMAEAIGWGRQPVGWSDILALARDPKGWAGRGHPEWGQFKFGHTHPLYSNSGLISLFAEVYAATGKVAGLTSADVSRAETAAYLSQIEQSVVHYGSSTGFFGKKMFANGPQYLSAAVLYENMVIESHSPKYSLPFPVVAIYPKEGAFWSDHPVGIVEREWVTPEHREAAKLYMNFLLARPQQERAIEFGFRPSAVDVPLGAPIDLAHGVDPKEPKTTLEVPTTESMDAILRLWRENKKHANVTLVLDVSGSMNEQNKLANAKAGAAELLQQLDDRDTFALNAFNNQVMNLNATAPLQQSRREVGARLNSLMAQGGTALYDAIASTYQAQLSAGSQNTDKISAIVVLTDGADTNSAIKLPQLLEQIRFDNELHTIRVFTIGYGKDAQKDVLRGIADATQAKFYEGTPENIREVFKDVSTFF